MKKHVSSFVFIGLVIFGIYKGNDNSSSDSEKRVPSSQISSKPRVSNKKKNIKNKNSDAYKADRKGKVEKRLVKTKRSKKSITSFKYDQKKNLNQKRSIANQKARRESKYLGFLENTEIKFATESYLYSASLVAKPEVGGALFSIAGYGVFEEELEDEFVESNEQKKILFNQSTKRFAVLTGNILISPKKNIPISKLEAQFGAKVIEGHPHLNLYVLRLDKGNSLLDLQDSLASSSDVEFYEIEIIEGGIFEK